MRINRYIALSGVCSRRKADELVSQGKVSVNGSIMTDIGTDIDEENDSVMVNGRRVKPISRFTYIILHKPKSVMCTNSDEKGRKTVFDFLEQLKDKKLFCVGRLDYDTEGLVLLTNDGRIAQKMAHPSNGIGKTYQTKINGILTQEDINKLQRGVTLADGTKLAGAKVKVLEAIPEKNYSKLELTIYEGKNHEIKNMFETLGKQVVFLKRTAIGDIKLGGLSRGAYRFLNAKELKYISSIK